MGNSDRVCAYCGKHEVKARGLCNACYIRLQRHGDCKYKRRKTNADRLRRMTDEELAEWLCDIAGWLPMYEGKMHPILDWLKEESEQREEDHV